MKTIGVKRVVSFVAVVVVSAAALAAVYSDFVFNPLPRDLMGMGDHWLQNGPYAYFSDWALQHGELPLWNPLTECGKPHAANPQVALFYPPNFLRSMVTHHPTPMKTFIGIAWLIAAHILMAAVATYYFARSHQLSRGASWIVSLAFVFSANFLLRAIVHWPFVAIMAWLPVLMLLVQGMLKANTFMRKLPPALAAGMILGFTLLVGFPQLDLYMAATMCAYAGLYYVSYRPWQDGERRAGGLRLLGRDVAALAVVFAVCVPVAAATLYPAAELSGFTARVKESAFSFEFDTRYQHSIRELLHCLISYTGAAQPENLRFVGAAAFLLACAALLYAKRRDVFLFGVLFLILLDCTFGTPFPFASLMQALAPFRMFSPERAVLFACFPLAMLAGLGADALATSIKERSFSWARGAALIVAGVVVCYRVYRWTDPDPNLRIAPALAVAGPAAALALIALAVFASRVRALPWLFAAAVLAENLIWSHPYERAEMNLYPYYPTTKPMWERTPEDMAQAWPRSDELEPRFFEEHEMALENIRSTSVQWNMKTFDLIPAMNGYETLFLYGARQTLCSPWAESRYTREINHYEVTRDSQRGNLLFKRSFWLARQYVTERLPGKDRLFPATTTVFLPDAPDDLPLPRKESEDVLNHSLSSSTSAIGVSLPPELTAPLTATRADQEFTAQLAPVPLAYIHSAMFIEYRATSAGWLEPILDESPSGRRELGMKTAFSATADGVGVIEIPMPDFERVIATLTFRVTNAPSTLTIERIYFRRDRMDENNFIRIGKRTANSVELGVGPLPDVRILTFLDATYLGWSAYIDSGEAPIYLADDAFKAIVVPPGSHNVRFEFKSDRVYIGFAVSVLSIIAAALAITLIWLRNRFPAPSTA